jgi:uncharacterized membrane protein
VDTSTDNGLLMAKEPISVVAGTYGHPVHPILVTLPIGMWVASFIFDIISRNADDGSAFANGAYWLIGLGIIGAALAALFGLMDLLRVRRGTRAFTTGLIHMALNVIVLILFVVSWFVRRGRDGFPPTSTGLIILSIVALVLLSASGVLGGMLAYRYGVRVADEATQRTGFEPSSGRTR